jgi:hypothetical protein
MSVRVVTGQCDPRHSIRSGVAATLAKRAKDGALGDGLKTEPPVCPGVSDRRGTGRPYYEKKRRRAKPARLTRPVPSKPNVPGSGTVVPGVVEAKQVGELPQKAPATWMFPVVIPLEVSALLRTKNNEVVVALPVVSRQIVCFPIPPHAPNESEPTLTSLIIVVPFSFTLPENPTTGPPRRTAPDVIWMSTQTEVLEMLMPLHIPP